MTSADTAMIGEPSPGRRCRRRVPTPSRFTSSGAEGLKTKKPGRKPKLDAKDRELAALQKKNAELERKLRVANSLIDLQKKGLLT